MVAHQIDGWALAMADDGTRAIVRRGDAIAVYDGLDDRPRVSEWPEWPVHDLVRARRIELPSVGTVVMAMGYLAVQCFDLASGDESDRIVTSGAELVTATIAADGRLIATVDKLSVISLYHRDGTLRWSSAAAPQRVIGVAIIDGHVAEQLLRAGRPTEARAHYQRACACVGSQPGRRALPRREDRELRGSCPGVIRNHTRA